MISICIPIYNFDVRELVKELQSQLENNSEIILIDDASKENFKKINRSLESEKVRYIELEGNIGRAKIRNLFIQYTINPYLIFLDCDAKILSKEYLENYRKAIDSETQVICGGSVYNSILPDIKQVLRWKYGTKKESKTAEERTRNPYSSFMTSNFLIKTTLFKKLCFDERITQYGHEDTLFGIELKKNKITIQHIQNPVLNDDVDTNEEFIEKTELALASLFQITQFYPDVTLLEKHILLLKIASKVQKWQLKWFFNILYSLFYLSIIKYLLRSKNPSLRVFDVYRLIYFLKIKEV